MKKVNEITKIGKLTKDTYKYEVFSLGNASFFAKCNGKPIEKVFNSQKECEECIKSFPEM